MSDEERDAYALAARDAKRATELLTTVATLHLIGGGGDSRRYQGVAKEAAEAAYRLVALLEGVK